MIPTKISERVFQVIDQGREGRNHGYSMGLPKLEGIMDGVTRETYTLIMSNSGAGKTSLVLYSYVYRPIMEHLNDGKYKVFYFSLEMNEISLYLKLLSIHVFLTEGRILSFKEITSKKKDYILSDEDYKILSKYRPWLDEISNHLEIYDKNVTAKGAYKQIKLRLEQVGKFTESDNRIIYTPNDPDLIYNFIMDHVGLLTVSTGHSLKSEIDEYSSMCVYFREKTGASFTNVQQANREQGNIERFKANKSAFTINDAKDTGNTVQDCNVFLAVYNPKRDGLSSYQKYLIKDNLESRFRSIMCLKNRFGDCDIEVGVNFFGEINMFAELPRPEDIFDYDKYTTPDWILIKDEQKKEDVTLNTNKFKFTL
jgi:hypothetical protein